MTSSHTPTPSAISESLSQAGAKSSSEALPREILHNLQYQHNWSDLHLHMIIPSANPPIIDITLSTTPIIPSSNQDRVYLISGLPPRHSYIHPDFLNHLIKHDMHESDVEVQREWVLPMTTGQRWSLKEFCHVFDHLPVREVREGARGFRHHDPKRVLAGMKANDGRGGDGTIVYYIMQEGEVKPRQN